MSEENSEMTASEATSGANPSDELSEQELEQAAGGISAQLPAAKKLGAGTPTKADSHKETIEIASWSLGG